MTLLERLADKNEFLSMTMNEKLLATLYVAILGMGITFLVLVFLQYCIKLMSTLLNGKNPKAAMTVKESNVSLERPVPPSFQPEQKQEDEEELIAVLTAAVAAHLGQSADRIVVRNVRRLSEGAPNWARAGLIDQMNLRRSH